MPAPADRRLESETMDPLLRFDDEGDPTVDPDPAAGSAEPDPAPAEAWGQGAADGDGTDLGDPGAGALDVLDATGETSGGAEGSWDVFWDRSLDPTDIDPLEPDPLEPDPFGHPDPFGSFETHQLPAPGDGADDVDLGVDLAADPGAGEGEMGAGPV